MEYFVKDSLNPASITNSAPLPQLAGELDSSIDSNVNQILIDLAGKPQVTGINMGATSLTWPDAVTPTITAPNVANIKDAAIARQQDIAARLKQLLKAQYATKSLPVGGTILTVPYYATEAKNFLFVVIPESDWEAHKNDANFSVLALLHKAGDANAPFPGTRQITIDKKRFEEHSVVTRPYNQGSVRWAVVDPTHTSISIPDLNPDKIASMEKLLQQLNRLNQ